MSRRTPPVPALVVLAIGGLLLLRSAADGAGVETRHLGMVLPFAIATAVALMQWRSRGRPHPFVLWWMFGTSFAAVNGVSRALGSPIEGGPWVAGVVMLGIGAVLWLSGGAGCGGHGRLEHRGPRTTSGPTSGPTYDEPQTEVPPAGGGAWTPAGR